MHGLPKKVEKRLRHTFDHNFLLFIYALSNIICISAIIVNMPMCNMTDSVLGRRPSTLCIQTFTKCCSCERVLIRMYVDIC